MKKQPKSEIDIISRYQKVFDFFDDFEKKFSTEIKEDDKEKILDILLKDHSCEL